MPHPLPTLAATVLCAPACSFASTLNKVRRMARDPSCPPRILSDVLASDPMLTALALSRAGGASDLSDCDLEAAVAQLGLAAVAGLAEEVEPIADGQKTLMASCWAQATATATLAGILIPFCRTPPELSSTAIAVCALLHDLGGIMARFLHPTGVAAAATRIETERELTLAAAMRREIGLDPGGYAVLIARSWRLPSPVAMVMRHHDQPLRASEHQSLVALIHVARTLARGCGHTPLDDPYLLPLEEDCLTRLGLSLSACEQSISQLFRLREELDAFEGVLGRRTRQFRRPSDRLTGAFVRPSS